MALTQIPLLIYVPGTYVEITARSGGGLPLQPHEVLVTGQILSTGTMAPNTVYQIDSADDAIALAGAGSQLAQIVQGYRAQDSLTPVSIVGVADASGGTAASGKFGFAGTATESRALALYVAGSRILVGVATGDTAAAIAQKVLDAVTNPTDLPVTLTKTAADVIVTARHKGSVGASVFIGHSQLQGERPPSGITITLTAMTGGTTDPDYSGVISALGDSQYNTLALPIADVANTGLFAAELDRRWGPLSMLDGVAFTAKADTRANVSSYVSTNLNSGLLYVIGTEVSPLKDPPWVIAAKTAAISALQAQSDPSLHPTGDILVGSRAAKKGTRFSFSERNALLGSGVSTLNATSDGRLAVERLVSTYTKNAQGLPDTALRDLHKVRTLSAMRYSFRVTMSNRYPKAKLSSDGPFLPAGQVIMTPDLCRAECIAQAETWVRAGWMEAGSLPQFKQELQVQRTASDRLECLLPVDVMDNMFVLAANLSAVG